MNGAFISRILRFSVEHQPELRTEQAAIADLGGITYPLMKLVDMYFWQTGYDLADRTVLLADGQSQDPS